MGLSRSGAPSTPHPGFCSRFMVAGESGAGGGGPSPTAAPRLPAMGAGDARRSRAEAGAGLAEVALNGWAYRGLEAQVARGNLWIWGGDRQEALIPLGGEAGLSLVRGHHLPAATPHARPQAGWISCLLPAPASLCSTFVRSYLSHQSRNQPWTRATVLQEAPLPAPF